MKTTALDFDDNHDDELWDLVRGQVGGDFLGKLMKEFPSRIVEQCARATVKKQPADWRSYLRGACRAQYKDSSEAKEKKKASAPTCHCGAPASVAGRFCAPHYEDWLDRHPDQKSDTHLMLDEMLEGHRALGLTRQPGQSRTSYLKKMEAYRSKIQAQRLTAEQFMQRVCERTGADLSATLIYKFRR